jgi:hypothetical protein
MAFWQICICLMEKSNNESWSIACTKKKCKKPERRAQSLRLMVGVILGFLVFSNHRSLNGDLVVHRPQCGTSEVDVREAHVLLYLLCCLVSLCQFSLCGLGCSCCKPEITRKRTWAFPFSLNSQNPRSGSGWPCLWDTPVLGVLGIGSPSNWAKEDEQIFFWQ